jgi:hypothetical protein
MTAVLSYFFPDTYGKDPQNCKYFLESINNKIDVCEKYHLLQLLDRKYDFISDSDIYLLFEFELFRKLITTLPTNHISDYEYYRYIEEFNRIPEEIKSEERYNITVRFICDIFKSYCTDSHIYSETYIKNSLALCVAFGKKGLNKRIRRNIYANLHHEEIINTKDKYTPKQAAILKVYCRFMNLSGQTPDTQLTERLKTLEFTEKKNTATEDNTKYNKAVRLFKSILMDSKSEARQCNVLTEEDIDDSSKIPTKNYNYYILHNNHVCKTKNGKVSSIVNLVEFSEDKRQEIVDKINSNLETLVIKTTYVNNDSTFELVIFDIKGQNYLKRWWSNNPAKYCVKLCPIVE